MVKIEIQIDETRVANFGSLIIGEFIEDRKTGEIIGIDKLIALGFIINGNIKEDPVIYGKVKKCRQKKSFQHC